MSLKSKLADLRQMVAPPLQVGSAVSYADPMQTVARGIQGDPAVLTALALNPRQNGLTPDSGDHLFEVVRALWFDKDGNLLPPPSATALPEAPQTAGESGESEVPVSNFSSSPPALRPRLTPVPPPTTPPAEVATTAPTPPLEPGATPPEPSVSGWMALMLAMADDGLLPCERANSMGETTVFMDRQRFYRPPDLIVTDTMRKPGVLWLRAKSKVRFQNPNNCNQWWEADPLVRQPLAAPSWIKQDTAGWNYAVTAGMLEEV